MDYGGSLENCWRRKSPVGSNPTPSAIYRELKKGETQNLAPFLLLKTFQEIWRGG